MLSGSSSSDLGLIAYRVVILFGAAQGPATLCPLLQHTQAPGGHRAQQHLDPWQEVATWRKGHRRQRRAAVPGEPARCGSEHPEVGAALPQELLRWAASAQPGRSEAPGAGQAYSAAPPLQLPGTAARTPASHSAPGYPVLSCPARVLPPQLLPASSQGRATAVACTKLRFPQAALAAGCAPLRPRRILRSPCRPAAISDRRQRNLPKTWPGNGRTCLRQQEGNTEVFATLRTHPKAEAEATVGSALRHPKLRLDAGDCEKGQARGLEEVGLHKSR